MKRIIVKLTGAVAAQAGTKNTTLTLAEDATYAEVIHTLGLLYPNLIGLIIDADGRTMLSSNLFLVNGHDYVMVGMWDQSPQDGDTLLLVSPVTGG